MTDFTVQQKDLLVSETMYAILRSLNFIFSILMTNKNKKEEKLLKTDLRTLWSDTLVEMLHEAVNEDWSESAVREIVRELYNKGYKTEQLIAMIDKKIGPNAAARLARFIID